MALTSNLIEIHDELSKNAKQLQALLTTLMADDSFKLLNEEILANTLWLASDLTDNIITENNKICKASEEL